MGIEQKILYFSEEFTWLKEHSAQVPFTIICAPSGYGKTIALRSITGAFKGKVFRINFYGSRQQDFFEEFCQTILKRNCPITMISDFIQNGVPKTTEEADKFLECLKKVCEDELCFIVIDNYCRVEKPEYTEFLYYIANELKEKLRIVVSACHLDLTNMEERITNGEIFYISKDDLRLKEKDIQPYFLANGVEISPEEANEIYGKNEGWFAMLYVMLRNYYITGKLSGFDDRSLMDMMKHNNYLLLPKECKRFLNRIFPAKIFTREAGIFLAGGGKNAEMLLDYTVDKSGFIFYNPNQSVYHFHPLYKKIIQATFSNLAIDEQNAIYKRYEAWKKEHFIDIAQPDLLKVFNEGSPKELEDKVEYLGIENTLDKEQLKQMLILFQKKESEAENKDK
jgi:LuxR family maltose regulon positive regulatory protein